MKWWIWLIIILLALLLLVGIFSDKEEAPVVVEDVKVSLDTTFPESTLLGFGYWPTDVTNAYQEDWTKRLEEANVDILSIQKGEPFLEETDPYTQILDSWLKETKTSEYKTYLGLEIFTGDRKKVDELPDSSTDSILSTEWQDAFEKISLDNVREHSPDYFNPCIEVNMWYEHATEEEWQAFRTLYNRVYAKIKEISPDTKVFCSLQYDLIAGKIWGNDNTQWELLDDPNLKLENQDLFGVSSYIYGDDYINWYQGLRERNIGPLFIAEIGYVAVDQKYPMTEKEMESQRKVVEDLPLIFKDLEVEGFLWLTLADLNPKATPGLPKSIYIQGILHNDLSQKSAWSSWKALKEKE